MEIVDIVARYPGSMHDNTIFERSRLRVKYENQEIPGNFCTGHKTYLEQNVFCLIKSKSLLVIKKNHFDIFKDHCLK